MKLRSLFSKKTKQDGKLKMTRLTHLKIQVTNLSIITDMGTKICLQGGVANNIDRIDSDLSNRYDVTNIQLMKILKET